MQPETAKRLFDALQAARRIQEFTKQLNFEKFSASDLVRAAVERQFEIIGEALGRAGESAAELEQRMPELPRIVGLRNRLIHGYDSVDDEIVWDIVQTKIGSLVKELEHLLSAGGFPH
jgi:uncharacterized protein with HEPN domain